LYGKTSLLNEMAPYQGGGNMITEVTIEESRFKAPPHKFEAGTGSIADAVGLGCAARYISHIGLDTVSRYERDLLIYTMALLEQMLPGITVIGNTASKSGIVSFYDKHSDSDELATLLDREGIAVRAGHHCAQPVLRRFGRDKVVRASFALYNTFEEVDAFISALRRITSR
jgi:cysteine desulfurase/selenocysteine lyase